MSNIAELKSEIVKFHRLYDVKSPARGTPFSAGIDFYVPGYSDEFLKALLEKNPDLELNVEAVYVPPHKSVLIPSGIKVKFNEAYALIAYNKSGVATKKGLDVGACVIDADYQGVVHFHMTNTTDEEVKIDFGSKIVQFLLIPIAYGGLVEVKDEKEMYKVSTARGDGGFGSTGVH